MAAIQNLNGINNVPKKISSKLSFDVGDNFSGKIIAKDENSKEVTVRTSDGWQFSAQLEDNVDQMPDKLVKFQVVGYENGKLKLKIMPGQQQGSEDSEKFLEGILKQNGLDKSNAELLGKMAQFSIPLTRDNISKIKTLIEFIDKLKGNSAEAQGFIDKYMASRGIEQTSEEGINAGNKLGEFFKALNTLSLEDILTLHESNIEITPENVQSYNSVVKGKETIYNIFENLKDNANESFAKTESQSINEKLFQQQNINEKEALINSSEEFTNTKGDVKSGNSEILNNLIKEAAINEEKLSSKAASAEVQNKDILINKLADVINKSVNAKEDTLDKVSKQGDTAKAINSSETEEVQKNSIKLLLTKNSDLMEKLVSTVKQYAEGEVKPNSKTDILQNKELNSKLESIIKSEFKNAGNIKNEDMRDIIKLIVQPYEKNSAADNKNPKSYVKANNHQVTANDVIKEMDGKTNSVKQIISELLNKTEDSQGANIENLMNTLKNNANDLKLFNDLSDKYYYMDMPLKFNEEDYPCKLIIKDDRKKGKKIDSTNVKIALSVATVNMGVVDAYIKVKESDMNIELKCDNKWIRVLDMAKKKLASTLSHSKYSISIAVNEREKELNIPNCREFFSEGKNSSINVRV